MTLVTHSWFYYVVQNSFELCGPLYGCVSDAPVLTTPFLDVKDEKTKSNSNDDKIDPSELGLEMLEYLSNAAGTWLITTFCYF